MKRFWLLLLCLALALPCQAAPSTSAAAAILMDADTGAILYESNADKEALIASTTKIMTALVVLERLPVDMRYLIPPEAVGIEGSSVYLQAGEEWTVEELLYGMMLCSGNDAAVALALCCCGSVEGFVQKMNERAASLGLRHTSFANPNGLDDENHYSTARDLAVLTACAMENEVFCRIVATKQIHFHGRQFTNHNRLLWSDCGAVGVKTGYTRAAGRILVSAAQQKGRRLIAVTINAPDDWQDHKALLEEGFSRYSLQRVVTKGDRVGTIEVLGGASARVELLAAENYVYAIAPEERPQLMLPGPGFAYAPVAEGADAGFAYVMLGGRAVGKVPVEYGKTIEMKENEKRSLWERLTGRD